MRIWVWGALQGKTVPLTLHSCPSLPPHPPGQPGRCSTTHFLFSLSKVGLNVLVQKANKFTPATRLLVQRFVPFPAVGKTCTCRGVGGCVQACVCHTWVCGAAQLLGMLWMPFQTTSDIGGLLVGATESKTYVNRSKGDRGAAGNLCDQDSAFSTGIPNLGPQSPTGPVGRMQGIL